MSLDRVTDHWEDTVSDYILEQYKGASNWKAILKSVIDEFTDIEGEIWKLASILDFKCRIKSETPTGALLDFCAAIVNVKRSPGESDASLYERFIRAITVNNAGTPDNVIYNAALLSGDTAPQYMDEAPATFLVYDGPVYEHRGENDDVLVKEAGQKQLTRAQVKKLAPCGVLGLPAAAIQFYDGTLLCDYDHKLIVMAADDANVEREILLINDGGNIMTTSQQSAVKVTIRGDSRYQTTPIHVDGVPGTIDGIRVKDLPDAQNDDAYMMRDSDVGGTTRTRAYTEDEFDALWDEIMSEDDDEEDDSSNG